MNKNGTGGDVSLENNPQDILRAWIALEVLSPQGYRK